MWNRSPKQDLYPCPRWKSDVRCTSTMILVEYSFKPPSLWRLLSRFYPSPLRNVTSGNEWIDQSTLRFTTVLSRIAQTNMVLRVWSRQNRVFRVFSALKRLPPPQSLLNFQAKLVNTSKFDNFFLRFQPLKSKTQKPWQKMINPMKFH